MKTIYVFLFAILLWLGTSTAFSANSADFCPLEYRLSFGASEEQILKRWPVPLKEEKGGDRFFEADLPTGRCYTLGFTPGKGLMKFIKNWI